MLITGASAGLGLESARVLAARGAHVVMAVRDYDKAKTRAEAIKSQHPGATLTLLKLDLTVLSDVRRCAQEFKSLNIPLHVLMLNAVRYSHQDVTRLLVCHLMPHISTQVGNLSNPEMHIQKNHWLVCHFTPYFTSVSFYYSIFCCSTTLLLQNHRVSCLCLRLRKPPMASRPSFKPTTWVTFSSPSC